MDVNEILKKVKFPFDGTYSAHSPDLNKKVRGRPNPIAYYTNWDDVYEQFNMNPKTTIIDLNPFPDVSYDIYLLIGNPNDICRAPAGALQISL